MNLEEKTLSSQELYRSKSYSFTVDKVQVPDGCERVREVFHHPGAVAVLAVNNKGQAAIVRQYRYPVKQVLTEIPAGKTDKDPNETILQAAQRELREETGCTAEVFVHLGDILTSPGVMTEVIHLFFAKGLKTGRQDLDEDEFLEDGWMDIEELRSGIASGEIQDAKTIIAVHLATLKGLI
ncbi:MAG: NUDIX hydrolase [Oscillospiraceae bacterium]|nr:NUDIX hydrolase [Oscillospiraceae bacterium]